MTTERESGQERSLYAGLEVSLRRQIIQDGLANIPNELCIAAANAIKDLRTKLTAARDELAEKDERNAGWLIENALIKAAPQPATLYFCGWKNGNSYLPLWLPDVERAIRFCRQVDAWEVGRALDVSVQILEHVWVAAPALTGGKKDE